MTKISVISVVKDDLSGLQRTHDSLKTQDHNAVEWVVVDGSSSDRVREWVQRLDDSLRVLYVRDLGQGIYPAMNQGSRIATGELVMFVNAGDRLAQNQSLARVATACVDDAHPYKAEWGYGLTRVVCHETQTIVGVAGRVPFNAFMLRFGLISVPHPSTFYRKEFLLNLGGFEEDRGVAADQILALKALAYGPPILVVDFLADFETGGASDGRSQADLVRDFAQLRRKSNVVIKGPLVDQFITLMCLAYLTLKQRASKATRAKV